MAIWYALRREPLIIFLAFAVAAFGMDYCLRINNKPSITITSITRDTVLGRAQAVKGSELNSFEEEVAINQYIDNKILIDEALKMGLNHDPDIHSKLVRKLRAILTAEVPNPDEQTLKHYYTQNIQDFMHPTLRQVQWVKFDKHAQLPEHYALQLNKEPWKVDAHKIVEQKQMKLSVRDINIRMGDKVAKKAAKASLNTWYGPIKSYHGVFVFRVLSVHDGVAKPFAEVKRYVRDAWIRAQQKDILQQKVSELKQDYVIQVDGG